MTWQTSYYHYDGQGSTLCLTDEKGDVTDQYAYTAFGEELDTGTANPTPNPFRYVGQQGYYRDADTGDYYVRARVYRPVLARWLSEDPIGYSGGINLYEYVLSQPVGKVDPSGKEVTPTEAQVEYAKANCKCACAAAINWISYLLGWTRTMMTSIMTDANAEVDKHTFDPVKLASVYFENPPTQAHIDYMRERVSQNGHLLDNFGAPPTPNLLHSALRHCFGAGFLARETSCVCSQCLSDHREYHNLMHDGQSLRWTRATLHNNYVGRVAAGCLGTKATVTRMKVSNTCAPCSAPAWGKDFKSREEIVSSCVDALKTGKLDVIRAAAPIGNAEVITLPDYVEVPE